jgi:GNAT superfamily N-acetyltransferase
MTLVVVPFTEHHLDTAAGLLAARHRRDRRRLPALPVRFEAIADARAEVETILAREGVVGVFATNNGRPAGFLLGEPLAIDPKHPFTVFVRPRSGAIPLAGHAVMPGLAREAYRALYAAVAAQWIAKGLDVHHVWLPATDRAAMAAWCALGFGQENTTALRPTTPTPKSASMAVSVRRATTADGATLTAQGAAILRDLSRPPTSLPLLSSHAEAGLSQMIDELLADPAVPQWLAMRDGAVIGMQLFAGVSDHVAALCAPLQAIYLLGAYTGPSARGQGVGQAMLHRSLAWARDAGYAWCVLDYMPANPAGSHFWEGAGFVPLAYRLCRQLDERVLATGHSQR